MPTANPPGVARPRRIDPEAQRRGALKGARIAATRRTEAARQADESVWPFIVLCRAEGHSLQEIAAELTASGILTRQGRRRWHPIQVQRCLERTLLVAKDLIDEMEAIADALRTVRRMQQMQQRRRRGRQTAGQSEADATATARVPS